MSSLPECKRCNKFIHYGLVICDDCLDAVLDKIDEQLVVTSGESWTYAKDIMTVVREALCSNPKGSR